MTSLNEAKARRVRAAHVVVAAAIGAAIGGTAFLAQTPSAWNVTFEARVAGASIVALLVGGIGAVLRAAAHQGGGYVGHADYVGKLFAVTAFVAGFTSAVGAAAHLSGLMLGLAVAAGVLIVFLIALLIWPFARRVGAQIDATDEGNEEVASLRVTQSDRPSDTPAVRPSDEA